MTYKVNLDSKELYALADKLDKYAEDFEQKVSRFLVALADLAIEVSRVNEGDFAGYIVYSKRFETIDGEKSVKMMAKSGTITRAWYGSATSQNLKEYAISPLLMAEFGSGFYAIESSGEAAGLGGQGTLNVYGHANDSNGWYWWTDEPRTGSDAEYVTEKEGRIKYHSRGQRPSQPLHKAVMACIAQVEGIAREVFG